MTTNAKRMDYNAFSAQAAKARDALIAMGQSAIEAGLDPALVEIIKLRASQMNGCSFCVQYHINAARPLHVSQQKLDMVAAWHHADAFNAQERAALALTEELTRLDGHGLSDETYQAAKDAFGEKLLAQIIVTVAAINAWNRIGVGLRFTPPPAA